MRRFFISALVGLLAVAFAVPAIAANPDQPNGFFVFSGFMGGKCRTMDLPCAAAATFTKGDVVTYSSGVTIATGASTTDILGVTAEACTAGVPAAGDYVSVVLAEGCIFKAQTSGTAAQATDQFAIHDFEGTTGIHEVDEDGTTAPVFQILGLVRKPNNAWGANAEVYGVFVRTQATWQDVGLADISTSIITANSGLSYSQSTGLAVVLETAKGLSMGANGLAVVIEASKGLAVGASGLATVIEASKGLTVGASGLATVVDADSMSAGAGGLAVVLQASKGLEASSGLGVVIEASKGLAVGASGLATVIEASKGLTVGASGLSTVVDSDSMSVGAGGLAVALQASKGLEASSGLGIVIEASKGLAVGASGLATVIEASKGLTVGASGLATVLETNKGLAVGASGLAVDYDGANIGINGSNKLDIKERCFIAGGMGDDETSQIPFVFPVAGTVQTTAYIVSEVGVAAHDTNYYSIDISDAGGNDMTAADRTTKITGGTAITALAPWALTLDQNLTVTAGEGGYLLFTESAAATDLSESNISVMFCIDTF